MLRWNTASNNVHSDENKFNQNQDLKYKKTSGYELMYPQIREQMSGPEIS